MLEAGQAVGPYELVRRLGSGAFGEVWLARHMDLNVERALKVPTDPDYVDQTGEDTMWDDPNTPCAFPGPCNVKSEYVAATEKTGNQLAMQPNHKFSLTAAYTMPMPNLSRSNMALGELQFLSTYSYTGSRHPYISNLPSQEMQGYGRWDARVQWTSDSGRWSASFFAQNIMDDLGLIEFIPLSTSSGFYLPAMGTLTDGRRLGFVLRWKM
jgi:serine/threonine protein kinase